MVSNFARSAVIRNTCRHKRTTSTNALGVSVSIFFGYPSLSKCADDTARSGTSSSPDGSCCQPSGSHYRPKPRDRKQPKASE